MLEAVPHFLYAAGLHEQAAHWVDRFFVMGVPEEVTLRRLSALSAQVGQISYDAPLDEHLAQTLHLLKGLEL
jgi:hypothetical protein